MNILTLNKHRSKLKVWCFKMPNFSYCHTLCAIFTDMKTIITSVLLLITSLTYSQSNYQIADSTKEWNTVNTGLNPGSIIECKGTTTNFFGGDTLVNGFNYLIVLETNDTSQSEPVNVGLLREDTATKQVFFKMGEDEGLIYDFNINVGDTIYIDILPGETTDEESIRVCDSKCRA